MEAKMVQHKIFLANVGQIAYGFQTVSLSKVLDSLEKSKITCIPIAL